MIHLYAIVRALRALPPRTGIAGAELRSVTIGDDVAGVVSTVTDDPERREGAVAHGLVVEALVDAAAAVLPVRYGERFADEEALTVDLAAQLPGLRERLAVVEGCVELSVRLLASNQPRAAAADGTTYMRQRLDDLQARKELAAALHVPLQQHARAALTQRRLDAAVIHDGCYLVRRQDATAFRKLVDAFGTAHPELTVVCTGPWAPYNFVSAERAA